MILSKNIALNISACLSGLPFSFDELVLETEDLFEKHGIPGFLKVLISFTDAMVVDQWKNLDDDCLRKRGNKREFCCKDQHLNRNGSRTKKIYTSLGNIDIEWTTLRCRNCGKSFYPLKSFFNLGKYQKVTNEFEKICMETVAKESFRFSAQTLNNLKHVKFNYRTLHGWFKKTNSDNISVIHDDLETLLSDGTGYKKFVSLKKQDNKNNLREKLNLKPLSETNRGEIKVMLGINTKGEVVPMGAWTNQSWKNIGNLIKRANNQNKKVAQKKVANILVADGEIGLNRGLYNLTHHQQRCLFHIPYELKPLMKYGDKAPDGDVSYALGQVHSIFEIKIPEKDFNDVDIKELVEMNQKIKGCKMQMKLLSEYLEDKGHRQAATYIRNAKKNLFTYLRYWMKTGIVTPKASSKIERLMREINRRIKKFAFNWSPEGCAKMTRIIIKLICDQKSWLDHWENKMKLSGNIKLDFAGISA